MTRTRQARGKKVCLRYPDGTKERARLLGYRGDGPRERAIIRLMDGTELHVPPNRVSPRWF